MAGTPFSIVRFKENVSLGDGSNSKKLLFIGAKSLSGFIRIDTIRCSAIARDPLDSSVACLFSIGLTNGYGSAGTDVSSLVKGKNLLSEKEHNVEAWADPATPPSSVNNVKNGFVFMNGDEFIWQSHQDEDDWMLSDTRVLAIYMIAYVPPGESMILENLSVCVEGES